MEYTDTIEIAAEPEVVWGLTVDVEGLPRVTPTISAAERLDEGPLHAGSQARLRQPGMPAVVWTVTEIDEPRRFVWQATVLGVTMEARHLLEPIDTGTRQTLQLVLSGRLAGVLATVGGARLRAAIAAENAGFREKAEGR